MREWMISCWCMIQPPASHHTAPYYTTPLNTQHTTPPLSPMLMPHRFETEDEMQWAICRMPVTRKGRARLHPFFLSFSFSLPLRIYSLSSCNCTAIDSTRTHTHTHTLSLSSCPCPLSVLLSVPLSSLFKWFFVTVQIHCDVRYMPFHSVRTQQYSIELESFNH